MVRTVSVGRKRDTRGRILDAALRIISREGAAHLTLESVAAEAALSKGGLLYHYTSKQALIQGLLVRKLAEFDAMRQMAWENLHEGPNRALLAELMAALDLKRFEPGVGQAILAASAESPSLLDPVRLHRQQRLSRIRSDANDADCAELLMLAADGLFFAVVLGIGPTERDVDNINRLRHLLLDKARAGEAIANCA